MPLSTASIAGSKWEWCPETLDVINYMNLEREHTELNVTMIHITKASARNTNDYYTLLSTRALDTADVDMFRLWNKSLDIDVLGGNLPSCVVRAI